MLKRTNSNYNEQNEEPKQKKQKTEELMAATSTQEIIDMLEETNLNNSKSGAELFADYLKTFGSLEEWTKRNFREFLTKWIEFQIKIKKPGDEERVFKERQEFLEKFEYLDGARVVSWSKQDFILLGGELGSKLFEDLGLDIQDQSNTISSKKFVSFANEQQAWNFIQSHANSSLVLKTDFKSVNKLGNPKPIGKWEFFNVKETTDEFKRHLKSAETRTAYERPMIGAFAGPGTGKTTFINAISDLDLPNTVFIPITFSSDTNVIPAEDDLESIIVIRFIRSAFFQSPDWPLFYQSFENYQFAPSTLFMMFKTLSSRFSPQIQPMKFVLLIDALMRIDEPVTCLKMLNTYADITHDTTYQYGFQIFIFATSSNQYPFIQTAKGINMEELTEEEALKERNNLLFGTHRDVLFIYLRKPSIEELTKMFKSLVEPIQQKNHAFQEKDMVALIFFCGGHYRTLVTLWEILQTLDKTDFNSIFNELLARIDGRRNFATIPVDLIRLALIGNPVSLDLQVRDNAIAYLPVSSFIQRGVLLHAFVEIPFLSAQTSSTTATPAIKIIEPTRIIPVLTPIIFLGWAQRNRDPSKPHSNLANVVYKMFRQILAYVREDSGFEDFHIEWEAAWRMVAPNVFPRYSRDFQFLIKHDISKPKLPIQVPNDFKPKSNQLINTLQYLYNLNVIKTNIKSVDIVTHDQRVVDGDYKSTVIDLFIAPLNHEKDPSKPPLILMTLFDTITEAASHSFKDTVLHSLGNTLLNATAKVTRIASFIQTNHASDKVQSLQAKEVKPLKSFLNLSEAKAFLGYDKALFVVISRNHVDHQRKAIIDANANNKTDVVIYNWNDLQSLYGQSLIDLPFLFDWK